MERDFYFFSTEDSSFQESLCLDARAGFYDQCTVGRCLDLYIDGTTDSVNLFFRPEDVDLSEGKSVVGGFYNQVRASRVHVVVAKVRA